MPQLSRGDGSRMCLNKSPLAGFLPGAQAKKGSGANTRTQLSFKLTSSPPPDRDSTRCVGAYDQANSGGLDEGVVDACGKPKSRGLRDVSAAMESLATRSNSPAQSIDGGIGGPASIGGAGLSLTGGVAFGRVDCRERGSGFLSESFVIIIVGAMNTN
jgi:hypothetical protein